MCRRKIKIALELILNRLPESWLEKLSLFVSKLKRKFALQHLKNGNSISLIRACDFIITLCNGNRFIEFELSNICNAQCIFCPYPDLLRSDKKFMHMQAETLDKSIDKLQLFKNALISFTPTTGDTLLHPEWHLYIKKIINQEAIAKATMFTNAIKLDDENRQHMIELLEASNGHKLSEIYFSVGGLDAQTYKSLYQVDRFDLVVKNISLFLKELKMKRMSTGVHIHIKLLKDEVLDREQARSVFNPFAYPFVYYSQSNLYFSNDAYQRNALINYKSDPIPSQEKACAYLLKTRFAADGGIWADGCVISEMPGDSSLKLGSITDDWDKIEQERAKLIKQWEASGEIPKPCQGCTVYRPMPAQG